MSDKEAQSEAPSVVDEIIDTCLHPERNGLLLKEQVAEGASHEWLVKRELKAKINRLIEQARENTDAVNRIEVIDDTGRAYVKGAIYGTPVKVTLSYQDDGRTLKVFVSNNLSKGKDNDN